MRTVLREAVTAGGPSSVILDPVAWANQRGATLVFWAEGENFLAQKAWADGDAITQTTYKWSDESGNGDDADAVSVGNEPIYRDGTTTEMYSNGQPCIEFDGHLTIAHGFNTGLTGNNISEPYTVLSIQRNFGYVSAHGVLHDGPMNTNKSSAAWPLGPNGYPSAFHTDSWAGGSENTFAMAYFGPTSVAVVYDVNRTVYVNGVNLPGPMGSPGTGDSDPTNEGLTLGSKNTDGSAGFTHGGWIAYEAVIPGEISAADLAAFSQWATRYGAQDWTPTRPRELVEQRRVEQTLSDDTRVLNFPSAPPEDSLLIAFVCSGTDPATNPHTNHTVTDSEGSWTKVNGVDVTTVGTMTMWYKQASATAPTAITLDTGSGLAGTDSITAEIRAFVNVDASALVQNRIAVLPSPLGFVAPAFTSSATQGNLITCAVFVDGVPGLMENWTNGWLGSTDARYLISGTKIADANDNQSSRIDWANASDRGVIMAEFAPA